MQAKDRTITINMMMEPHHANFFGNVHGGELLRLMDNTAGCAAVKYSKTACVGARVDELQFLKPVHVGQLVTCTATVVHTGTTSIDTYVTVDTEDIRDESSKIRAVEGFFMNVALGENGRPTPVPPFVPETERENKLYELVRERREFDAGRRDKAKQRSE